MILILGSGIAGLSSALAAVAEDAEVTLVTPGVLCGPGGDADRADRELAGGNTAMAQGGIAAAVGADDSAPLHAEDTVAAGVGLVDSVAAEVLTADGVRAVRDLIGAGFPADRAPDGALALGLEAAHRRSRIVHAGEDHTGAVLHAYLVARVLEIRAAGRLTIIERSTAVSLLSDAGVVSGAVLRDRDGQFSAVRADAVIIATGGYSGLYARTSGTSGARGEGMVLGARVGAAVADLEFVQFHPTALVGSGFLVSEAVRGAGAVLRDGSGARFMTQQHPAAELAPRDVVARALHRQTRDRGESCVWLDATGIEHEGGPGTLARRFPSITAAARAQGFDWAREPVPVAPAAHYTMGGLATDLDGRCTVPGLFAAGEAASTGVHGANRLASNSLLEGMVFGRRAGAAAAAYAARPGSVEWRANGHGFSSLVASLDELPVHRGVAEPELAMPPGTSADADTAADEIVRTAADAGLGIERDRAGLRAVAAACAPVPTRLAAMAGMVAAAAEARTESRGAHQRSDHPDPDPALARRRAWLLPATARSTPNPRSVPSPEESLTAC